MTRQNCVPQSSQLLVPFVGIRFETAVTLRIGATDYMKHVTPTH
eukprot:COSAG02_NODE_61829_length_267_cov_0.928571_1_plen_43_part_10